MSNLYFFPLIFALDQKDEYLKPILNKYFKTYMYDIKIKQKIFSTAESPNTFNKVKNSNNKPH